MKKLKEKTIDITKRTASCPFCYSPRCKRHSNCTRYVLDLDACIRLVYSKHYCKACARTFACGDSKIAKKGCHYSTRLIKKAVELYKHKNITLHALGEQLRRNYNLPLIPNSTLHDWYVESI